MVDKEIPLIKAKKTMEKDVILDPNGFFVIEVYDKGIRIEYYSNVYKNKRIVSGRLEKVFIGTKADALSDTIAQHVPQITTRALSVSGARVAKRTESRLNKRRSTSQGGC